MTAGSRALSLLGFELMDAEFALKFAEEWQEVWNSHDLDRLLVHYAEDVVFQSPYIVHRFNDPTGEVRGKAALRSYWSSGLRQQPDLKFTVDDVFLSVDTLVIAYRNQHGHRVSEVLVGEIGPIAPGTCHVTSSDRLRPSGQDARSARESGGCWRGHAAALLRIRPVLRGSAQSR
ncbi:MAG: nuclear transport factor 2 family protein [Acidimicrobiales bacterium]